MKIFLLSSVYPASYSPEGTTPVIHYFTKEWAAMGHDVHVFHTASCFPWGYYMLGRPFKKYLDSKLGHLMPITPPEEFDEEKDGVRISHINLKKIKPHGRYLQKQIQRTFKMISSHIEEEGVPDVFVGHWDNPQLELLKMLKESFHRPTCLVYHFNSFNHLYGIYGKDTEDLVKDVDLVGFRNITAQNEYEKLFGKPTHSFICASGVSKPFIEEGDAFVHHFDGVKKYTFVGSLIERKHPVSIIEALAKSYQSEPFEMTYIGDGNEKDHIQKLFNEYRCNGSLIFTGHIPRNKVIEYLKNSDVFVMISEGEIFGLVYLEAMALGCITIAARHEGVDGIIEDGINGFLCEAGNTEELIVILSKLQKMSKEELNAISMKARETACVYTDLKVAKDYLDKLKNICL